MLHFQEDTNSRKVSDGSPNIGLSLLSKRLSVFRNSWCRPKKIPASNSCGKDICCPIITRISNELQSLTARYLQHNPRADNESNQGTIPVAWTILANAIKCHHGNNGNPAERTECFQVQVQERAARLYGLEFGDSTNPNDVDKGSNLKE